MIAADCCTACGGDSRVLESRHRGVDGGIRRRRKCMRCGTKWTTAELRVQKGQTVIATPIQAVRDLRDRVYSLLGLLGIEQVEADLAMGSDAGMEERRDDSSRTEPA